MKIGKQQNYLLKRTQFIYTILTYLFLGVFVFRKTKYKQQKKYFYTYCKIVVVSFHLYILKKVKPSSYGTHYFHQCFVKFKKLFSI